MHPLHHGRILACSRDKLVLGGAGSEPAVALQAEGSAVRAGLILDATLDEKMISKDLGNCPILLKHVAPATGIFREGIEEIESGAIRIHKREVKKPELVKCRGGRLRRFSQFVQ